MKTKNGHVASVMSAFVLGFVSFFCSTEAARAVWGVYGVNRTIAQTRYCQLCSSSSPPDCSPCCTFNSLDFQCQLAAPNFCNPGDTFISATYGGDYPTSVCSCAKQGSCGPFMYGDIYICQASCQGSCNALCRDATTPVIVSVSDGRYDLTSLEDGVSFDLDADGLVDAVSWTAEGSDEGFVVLDRDGNGSIDSGEELFGDVTEQAPIDHPNGFNALALLDDNGDGFLDAEDWMFEFLELWFDINHNGISEPGELASFSDFYRAIDLDYKDHRRTDQHGNEFGYMTKFLKVGHGVSQAYDVSFVVE